MTHESANERARQLPVPTQHQLLSYLTEQTQVLVPTVRRRGKPATLTPCTCVWGLCCVAWRALGRNSSCGGGCVWNRSGRLHRCWWWIRPSTIGWHAPQA